jgi:hypothetical protein
MVGLWHRGLHGTMADAAQRISTRLAGLASAGGDAADVAAEAMLGWRAIQAVLVPIVGERGFAALLHRSLHDTRLQFPWLAWQRDSPRSDGLVLLRAALAGRSADDTVAATTALLHCFCGLLTSLIGAELTDRLLCTVDPAPARGAAAEDDPQ